MGTEEKLDTIINSMTNRRSGTELLMKLATGVSTGGIIAAVIGLFSMSTTLNKQTTIIEFMREDISTLKEFTKRPLLTHEDADGLKVMISKNSAEINRRGDVLEKFGMKDTEQDYKILSLQEDLKGLLKKEFNNR